MEERDLGKLGTVLAMCNETNRRALDLLQEQQRRQVRMVWASLAIVAVAFIVVGMAMYFTYGALEDLTSTVKELHHVQSAEISERLSKPGNTD